MGRRKSGYHKNKVKINVLKYRFLNDHAIPMVVGYSCHEVAAACQQILSNQWWNYRKLLSVSQYCILQEQASLVYRVLTLSKTPLCITFSRSNNVWKESVECKYIYTYKKKYAKSFCMQHWKTFRVRSFDRLMLALKLKAGRVAFNTSKQSLIIVTTVNIFLE